MHNLKVPSSWARIRLDKVATIQTGAALGKKGIKDLVELPYLRVANVQDGYLDLSEVKKISIERSSISKYLVQKDDILLTEGGDFDKVGRGTIWREEIPVCLHQNHVFVVRTKKKILDPLFFSYQAASPYGKWYFLSCAKQTTNLASINSSQLREFPVLLPPIEEQRKIAGILSTWDEAIWLTQALIAGKQQRKKGLMQRLLTGQHRFPEFAEQPWREVPLKDASMKVTDGTHKTPFYVDKGVPFLSTVNLIPFSDGFDFSSYQKFITEDEHSELTKRCRPEQGDLLISKCGTIGRTQLVRTDLRFSIFVGLALVKPDRKVVDPYYLEQLLNTEQYQRKMEIAAPGGTRATLTIGGLQKTVLFLPSSLEEQHRIADVLQACDREIHLLQQKLTALQQQKKGLMQRLLTGEVRVVPPVPGKGQTAPK